MERVLEEEIRGIRLKLKTRPGIFSPKGVDSGTRIMLDRIDLPDEGEIADLGAGAGIVGIVCAKLAQRANVDLLEDHVRSADLARENLTLNGVSNAQVYLSDLFSAVPTKRYDAILTNPPQQLGNEFLEELIAACYRHLKPGGDLWIVVKSNIAPVIKRLLDQQKARYDVVVRGKEYWLFRATR